jgi:hypothetical protein
MKTTSDGSIEVLEVSSGEKVFILLKDLTIFILIINPD